MLPVKNIKQGIENNYAITASQVIQLIGIFKESGNGKLWEYFIKTDSQFVRFVQFVQCTNRTNRTNA
jgi:hypothetical protein